LAFLKRPTYLSLLDKVGLKEPQNEKVALVAASVEDLKKWLKVQPVKPSKKFNPGDRKEKTFRGLAAVLGASEKVKLEAYIDQVSSSCKVSCSECLSPFVKHCFADVTCGFPQPNTVFFKCKPIDDHEQPVEVVGTVNGADAPNIKRSFDIFYAQCSFLE